MGLRGGGSGGGGSGGCGGEEGPCQLSASLFLFVFFPIEQAIKHEDSNIFLSDAMVLNRTDKKVGHCGYFFSPHYEKQTTKQAPCHTLSSPYGLPWIKE